MNILQIIRAGYITRWHAKPEVPAETVGQHHAAVVALCWWLTDRNASACLLAAAGLHDAHEVVIGDVPGPTKRAIPGLAAMLAVAEAEAEVQMGISDVFAGLSDHERGTLALADKLAAILHVRQTRPDLLALPEWREDVKRCRARAWALGPEIACKVEELFRGQWNGAAA